MSSGRYRKSRHRRIRASATRRWCPTRWDGRYAIVPAAAGDVVRLRMSIPETEHTLFLPKLRGRHYVATVRGSEIVGIDPPGQYCPIFWKPQYRTSETAWRTVERFVADDVPFEY